MVPIEYAYFDFIAFFPFQNWGMGVIIIYEQKKAISMRGKGEKTEKRWCWVRIDQLLCPLWA